MEDVGDEERQVIRRSDPPRHQNRVREIDQAGKSVMRCRREVHSQALEIRNDIWLVLQQEETSTWMRLCAEAG